MTHREQKGRAWKFGHNVDTDGIIPARYLNTSDPVELAKHCMEDVDPSFAVEVEPDDVIVAGRNFGTGSSREHAPIAIKAAGVSCVIASSYARIFYRNAFNVGLSLFVSPEASEAVRDGDILVVNATKGIITNLSRDGEEYPTKPHPDFMNELLEAGGLIPFMMEQRDHE